MDIRIFGGTGLIGSQLALSLSQKHKVYVISRDIAKHRLRFPSHISLLEWQGDDATLQQCVCGADAIINLVGEDIAKVPWSAQRKQLLYNSRVHIGRQLVQAIKSVEQQTVRVFIQGSGIGYYPIISDITQGQVSTEDSPLGKGTFLSYLAKDWEDSTKSLEALGIRRCIIRTSPVLAPHGGILATLSKPFRYYIGGYPSTGNQPFPFIHIEDEVRAIIHLIEKDSCFGAYNLITPEATTIRSFSEELASLLHKPCYLRIPQFFLRFIIGEMAEELLLQGVHAVPKRLLDDSFTFLYPDYKTALSQILL